MKNKMEFTQEQKDHICYQIGKWYIEWKNKLINFEDKTHRLGYAKEMLKSMICCPDEFHDAANKVMAQFGEALENLKDK